MIAGGPALYDLSLRDCASNNIIVMMPRWAFRIVRSLPRPDQCVMAINQNCLPDTNRQHPRQTYDSRRTLEGLEECH